MAPKAFHEAVQMKLLHQIRPASQQIKHVNGRAQKRLSALPVWFERESSVFLRFRSFLSLPPSRRFGASGHLPDSGGDQNVGAVGERRDGRLGQHQASEQGSAEAEEHGAEPAGQGAGAGHLEDAWAGTGGRDSLLAWLGACLHDSHRQYLPT